MASLFRKAAKGELPGQQKGSRSRKSSKSSNSNSPSPSGESGRNSPTDRVIPPEPIQQQLDGDFSLMESERPLQVHNLSRASKLCKALEWDNKLAKDAEAYAKTLASTGILERSGIEAQGENLYMKDSEATLEDAVDAWLNEEKKYNGSVIDESGLMESGQFTQCLWRNTLYVGMGRARATDGSTYIVARYAPPGNVVGERPF